MKVPWVFCSYSTTSSVRMMTVRVSPDFHHLSGPIRPLNHSRNQEKTSFFFSNSFLFCPMMTSLKETLWGRGGAPRLDATRCYSPWPAVTRRDSTRLAIERKSTWKSNSPTSSSFSSFFSFFSFFSSSWADPEIRFHLRFHFQQVFPCHFSLLFWREKNAFFSLLFLFSTAPAFLPSLRPPACLPGSCAQIEHKQIDFFYRQWEGTTMLDFLFLILCFIYSLFILYDIIKYLKLYFIIILFFIRRRRRSIYLSSRKTL